MTLLFISVALGHLICAQFLKKKKKSKLLVGSMKG